MWPKSQVERTLLYPLWASVFLGKLKIHQITERTTTLGHRLMGKQLHILAYFKAAFYFLLSLSMVMGAAKGETESWRRMKVAEDESK